MKVKIRKLLAKIVKLIASELDELPAKAGWVTIEIIDGRKHKVSVNLGAAQDDQKGKKDADAKNKILAASPEKSAPPETMTRILGRAKLGNNPHNRNKLWELVDEGELVSLKEGFRKAK